MFKNIKENIRELAYAAVNIAEQTLGSAQGQEKKMMAIEYVVSMLPITPPLKKFIVILLSKFIDESIELAVTYMKSVQNKEA